MKWRLPMPTEEDGLFFKTRRTRAKAGKAGTTGTNKVMKPEAGAPFTVAMCEKMVARLVERGFRRDLLITVKPVALKPQALAMKLNRLLGYYRESWGKRHAVGPDREPVWFDYFFVTALSNGGHDSHAHVVLDVELTSADIDKLGLRAKKWGIPLKVTRNKAAWLSDRPSVKEHRCKIEYTVEHLLRAGSAYEIGPTNTFPFVRRVRTAFRAWKASRPAPEAGGSLKLPKPLFKVPKKRTVRRQPEPAA